MQICLNRGTAGRGMPLELFVRLAADAGFEGADLDMTYGEAHGAAALRDLYAARSLAFGGWSPPGEWRGERPTTAEELKQLDRHAKVAAELGIDACATWIMPSSALPFMENWRFHVERLGRIARVLSGHGLRFGLEFVSPYHVRRAHAHEFIFTPGLMLELTAAVGPNVGLLVDVFHCYCSGTPWEHVAEIPGQSIVLAHLNDAPAVPLAQVQDGERVLPGQGAIDVSGFLAALRQTGYDGPVSLEVFSKSLDALPPAEAAKRAWEATHRVLPADW